MVSTVVLWVLAGAGHDVTFAEARRLAEQQAPEVQLARLRTAVARAEVGIAGAFGNPTLALTSGTQSARLGTGLTVPVPLFGQRGKALAAAEEEARVAELDVEVVRRDARWAVTVAWVELWEAQERERLLRSASTDAKRVLEIASEKFSAGTGARVDVLRTRADAARVEAEAEAASHLTLAAATRLGLLLGTGSGEALAATGAAGYPLTLPALEPRLNGHPTLVRDREQLLAATARVESEQRLRWPTLSAGLTVNQFDPQLPAPDFVFGLSFELPVLSQRGGAIERATAVQRTAQTAAALDARRLESEARDAWQRVLGSDARRRALRTGVLPDLEETRALTEDGYQMGRLELLRVLEAQRALLESRLGEVDASAQWVRAVADLERAGNLTLEGATDAP